MYFITDEFHIKKETIKFVVCAVILASVFAVVYLTNQYSGTDSSLKGMPLDDSYILFQYAKMFAQYGKFYYNPGDLETGATSPLWVMFLSIPYKLGIDLVLASKVMGLTLHILTAVILFAMLLEYTKNRFMSWAGGIFVLFSSVLFFYSLSGMDVTLFIFLLVCVFYFFTHKKYSETGFSVGLAILARPEGFIMLLFIMMLYLFRFLKEKNLSNIPSCASIVLIALVVAVPWFYYCFSVTGFPLPATFYLKTHYFLFHSFNFILLLWPSVEFSFSLFALLLLIIYERKWLSEKLSADNFCSFIFFPFFYLFPFLFYQTVSYVSVIGFDTYLARYWVPILPFTIFFVTIFLEVRSQENAKKFNVKREFSLGVVLIIFILILLANYLLMTFYSLDTASILNQPVTVAKWVDANIPANARIGIDDAGAIIFFSSPASNHTFIDLVYLNSHVLIDHDLYDSIKSENLTYLVIHQYGSDQLSSQFNLRLLQNVTFVNNTVSQSNTEYVYKIEGTKMN